MRRSYQGCLRALAAVAMCIPALLFMAGTAGAVDTNPQILSNWETSNPGDSIVRDCGYGIPDPTRSGQDIWLFCDSIPYEGSSFSEAILGTGTAAEGPYTAGSAPQSLSELPTPPSSATLPNSNGPAPFMPLPTGLVDPYNDTSCPGSNDGVYPPSYSGDYPASWFTGVAREPGSSHLLISFQLYCVVPSNSTNPFYDEGFGVVDYNPATNTLGTPKYVFTTMGGATLPLQQQLTNPVFSGGYLYFFSSQCTSSYGDCLAGDVYAARVQASSSYWGDPSKYRFWNGSRWGTSYASSANVISGVTPFAISVGSYPGKGLVLLADAGEYSNSGIMQVYTGSSPTSWSLLTTDNNVLSDTCNSGAYGCYALNFHPELSTSTNLAFTYYDPGGGSNGLGHLYMATYPW
jgi:hypothetical protein